MCGVDVQDVSMHNVGGDLERKLKEKAAREKSEKLIRLEKLEEEKTVMMRSRWKKRRGKRRGRKKKRKRRPPSSFRQQRERCG